MCIRDSQSHGETAEVEMVLNGGLVPTLAVDGADFVFEFFEAAFDLPTRRVVLNHVCSAESQVRSNEREEATAAAMDEDDLDPTSERFGDTDDLREHAVPVLSVDEDALGGGRRPQVCCQF